MTLRENRFLVKEMQDKIVSLERYYGLQIEDEAVFLAARIAQHPRNKTKGEFHERFFDIVLKGIKNCLRIKKVVKYKKQFDKHTYILQRAEVEYEQLIKEKISPSRSFWLWQIDKELKDTFLELVMFMKLRMRVEYDELVACVHNAKRFKDYTHILEKIDGQLHGNFKEKLAVGVEEIAEIASELTGIPASWHTTKPEERYMRVQERLKKRVVGQNDTIDVIFEALIKKPKSKRPLGFFLFAGPYSSDKAALAKAIADELYDDNDGGNSLIHFDMGMYAELNSIKHFVDSIAAMVKNRPYSVLLFDKIEKASASDLDILIRSLKTEFEEENAAIDFTNTLIIMTSDLEDEQVYEVMLSATFGRVNQVTGSLFKPELLNLLDKLIVVDVALPLLDTTRLLLREWACGETNRRNKAVIACPSTPALVHIASKAASKYGENVQGLKRWMDQRVVSPMMSKMMVENDGVAGVITVYIDVVEEIGALSFNLKLN